MNIASAVFDRSAPDLSLCPDESLPEFAFIGRSNVGKSSLLNMLTGQAKLARVSPMPGFTKTINFFIINGTWRLVDLPGYGFAQVARKDKAKFNEAVAEYLQRRPNLRGIFVLIDSRLPPQKLDLEFLQWLASFSAPSVLVFTKVDKLSSAQAQASIEAFKTALAELCESLPEIFTSSSVTRAGRRELLEAINATLAKEPLPPPVSFPKPAKPSSGARNSPPRRKAGAGDAPWLRLANQLGRRDGS